MKGEKYPGKSEKQSSTSNDGVICAKRLAPSIHFAH
jgi:hypothetical protein